jgi:hypothetical protein
MKTHYILGDENHIEMCEEPARVLAERYPRFNITSGTIKDIPDDCDLLIADHVPQWHMAIVEKYVRAHPATKLLVTREFYFPYTLTKSSTIPNARKLKREELLAHGLDWLLEEWDKS